MRCSVRHRVRPSTSPSTSSGYAQEERLWCPFALSVTRKVKSKYERRSAQIILQDYRPDSLSISADSELPPSVVQSRANANTVHPRIDWCPNWQQNSRAAMSRTHKRHTYNSWPVGYPRLAFALLSAPSVPSPRHLINSSPVSDSNAAQDLATCSLRSADSSSKIADRRSGV
jgi:hypothetical protein